MKGGNERIKLTDGASLIGIQLSLSPLDSFFLLDRTNFPERFRDFLNTFGDFFLFPGKRKKLSGSRKNH
ncbi:hypothetical protein SAMN05216436_106187 [bacterium A37T11]|nr:hypothetical protein SAMN05216436_106187 [bacterium A37T11]